LRLLPIAAVSLRLDRKALTQKETNTPANPDERADKWC